MKGLGRKILAGGLKEGSAITREMNERLHFLLGDDDVLEVVGVETVPAKLA
jgi:hypothetical protein